METEQNQNYQGILKTLLIDLGPFICLFMVYSALNSIVEGSNYVVVKEIYDLEILFFGWLFEGKIPSFWFHDHQSSAISIIAALLYSLHFIIPLISAVVIGYVTKDKEKFLRFKVTMFVTTSFALITFIVMPVAPPWYVWNNGFAQPTTHRRVAESAAGLLAFDKIFGVTFFGSFYASYNATPYAAVPSLHSAFSLICAIMLVRTYKEKSNWAYLSFLYPISIWFSAVYLQHHYILDVAIGIIYVLVSDLLASKVFIPYLNKEEKPLINKISGLLN